MLPPARRLRSSRDIQQTVRLGRRSGNGLLTVHVLDGSGRDSRAALVVGRSVGNSVVRHRVQRRLRHLLATRLPTVPSGTDVVVRAGPAAAAAASTELAAALDRALERALERALTRPAVSSGSRGHGAERVSP